ncbi:dihydrofolate reductase family protein [Amnibacterium flavum]|uniref:Pyrimidine reductase n=1 Tax=Amnibacterium flavum TaxID=2173173 RepID=A0A2V1HRM8_9MICO|nr:dihydrofolate reductase family protein [Amnibacterium flavum]PVZ94312.1 pyrimidine reductase [Amnibacterium flavum]
MSFRVVHPEPSGPHDERSDASREVLVELYAPASAETVRVNMIESINGSAVGDDVTSESLSNRLDRRILGVIRDASDAVVVGASTVRQEGYLAPARSRLAIITRSGDLAGHRLDSAPQPPIVLGPETARERVESELTGIPHEFAALDSPALDATEIVRVLRANGARSIVCEGGPTLAGTFLSAGVVDELCLTTAARLHSPGVPLLGPLGTTIPARLTQLIIDDASTLYARWALGAD